MKCLPGLMNLTFRIFYFFRELIRNNVFSLICLLFGKNCERENFVTNVITFVIRMFHFFFSVSELFYSISVVIFKEKSLAATVYNRTELLHCKKAFLLTILNFLARNSFYDGTSFVGRQKNSLLKPCKTIY